MSVDPTDLSAVSEDEVKARKEILRNILKQSHPDLTFEEGTINQQIILQPNAEIDALQRLTINKYRQSNSISAINADPTLADNDLVDAVLSNFQITRRSGTAASGYILLIVDASATYSVLSTSVFTVNERTFSTTADYTLVTDETLVSDTNLMLRERTSGGNWWAYIPVEETVVGGATIEKGTSFTMAPEISNFVAAYALNDFTAGIAEETNAELLARLEEGTAMQSVGDRTSIAAVIKENFTTVSDVGEIGIGDDESVRDANHLLGISVGGKSDIYIRSASVPTRTRVIALGTYTGVKEYLSDYGATGYFKNYQISLDLNSIAPFYRVATLTYMNPANEDSTSQFDYEFTAGATVTGWSESGRALRSVDEDFSPVIADAQNAVYSRYQGAVTIDIAKDLPQSNYQSVFEELVSGYTETETIAVAMGDGTTQDLTIAEIRDLIDDDTRRIYDIYVDVMPYIEDIQDFLNTRGNRPPGADYLVKAVFPCFVSVELTIVYDSTTTAPTELTIQEAVASAVNSLALSAEELSVLTITDAVKSVLPTTAYISLPVELTGNLRLPDGTKTILTSTSKLELPTNADMGVSSRTTAFILRPADVDITYKTT